MVLIVWVNAGQVFPESITVKQIRAEVKPIIPKKAAQRFDFILSLRLKKSKDRARSF
ncbi:hypothetical protein LEP1GSC198_1373 [Leptospira kirschneri str. JB]|nr:hypothetical protein LEP1GSC198_1373 [Leptospira kirschneri str. JB]